MSNLPLIREITTADYHPRNYPDDIGGAGYETITGVGTRGTTGSVISVTPLISSLISSR